MSSLNEKIWNERWHLAALQKPDFVRIGLLSVMVGLIILVFHFQGNTTDVKVFGRSVFSWLMHRWNVGDGNFTHGWLIPPVSIGLIWWRRHQIDAAQKKVSRLGLVVVVLGLLLHWMAARAQFPRASLMAVVMLCWGIPFYLYGWRVARLLIFPCAYLIFCIPLNFIDSLTFPLRMMATVISTALINGLGIMAERSGSAIYLLSGSQFQFDVADPCSGLRSLLAMTAITAVYANLTQRTLVKQWILFLASIPLAIIGNIARITTVALVAQGFGQQLALGLYHDYSGYVVFSVGIGLMVAVGGLLNLNYRKMWTEWKLNHINPT